MCNSRSLNLIVSSITLSLLMSNVRIVQWVLYNTASSNELSRSLLLFKHTLISGVHLIRYHPTTVRVTLLAGECDGTSPLSIFCLSAVIYMEMKECACCTRRIWHEIASAVEACFAKPYQSVCPFNEWGLGASDFEFVSFHFKHWDISIRFSYCASHWPSHHQMCWNDRWIVNSNSVSET